MIKCLYDENCAEHYPECKNTCGMTMTELAFRKDEQIRELKRQMITVRRDQLPPVLCNSCLLIYLIIAS